MRALKPPRTAPKAEAVRTVGGAHGFSLFARSAGGAEVYLTFVISPLRSLALYLDSSRLTTGSMM